MGWTYEEIDKRTLHEADDIFEFWRGTPPLNELAAAYVGWEKPKTAEDHIAAGAMDAEAFIQHFKETGGKVN